MKLNKRKYRAIITISAIICLIFQPIYVTTDNPLKSDSQGELRSAAVISGTKQWINNSGFDSPVVPWYGTLKGDDSDVNTTSSGDVASFFIKGDQKTFDNVSGTPKNSDWSPGNESAISINHDNYGIDDNNGCWANHEYREGVGYDQSRNNPIIQWNRNITMPFDMSDYVVISANVSSIINGSADLNVETPFENIEGYDNNPATGYAAEYDNTRFYVLISDLQKIEQYEIAYNQTIDLGRGYWPQVGASGPDNADNITDSEMIMIDEEDLVFYLNRVLEQDNQNFTITLGIDTYNEDNYDGGERDTWYYLYIKTYNLTFDYQKQINQFTTVSWNQDGQKLSDLSPYDVVATGATLNFKFKADKNWTATTSSQNSEIRIIINGNQYSETIKLTDANSTFQMAKVGGFDVTQLITDDVNLSIQVYIGDEFLLDQPINISIDDVELYISYSIFVPEVGESGNGGGTRIIRGPDYTPIIIGLTAGIIGVVAIFSAYQLHYKHPPMVRKIRKLKKKIKKGKKLKSLILNSREELIRIGFKKYTHQVLELDKIQSDTGKKVAKLSKTNKINKNKGVGN